ncbi:MAG: MucBP domain-containing protein, partial [Oscillospiraceae bacterium]|nr:MucBP domain-containing protein [Oscillospiraceae bacterium]
MKKMWKTNLAKVLVFFFIFVEIMDTVDGHRSFAYITVPAPSAIINGGFETVPTTPNVTAVAAYQLDASLINGWNTSATDNLIEIWRSGFQGNTTAPVPAHSGNYFAEINGTMAATLYQNVATESGTLYRWSLWHRGRHGLDTARVLLGTAQETASPAFNTNNTMDLNNGKNKWGFHQGFYLATGTSTWFGLEAVSTAAPPNGLNNMSQGNFIDDINLIPISSPTAQTIHIGDPAPDESTLATIFPIPASIDSSGEIDSGVYPLASYADASEYTTEDGLNGITPLNPNVPGIYNVKVRITDASAKDSSGNPKLIGYIYSTITVEATLTMKFVDESGGSLMPDTVVTYDSPVPIPPSLLNVGDEVISNGITYIFKEVESGSAVPGETMDSDKQITYVFEKKPQSITVNYLDISGNQLKDSDVINLKNGDNYFITACKTLIIDGVVYDLVETTGDALSGVMDTDKIINVVYDLNLTLNEKEPQTITVNYLDQNGNPIAAPSVQNLFKGDPYDVSNSGTVTISAVIYKVIDTKGDPVSGIADTDKIVSYYLLPPEIVTVNYLDKNGDPLADPDILSSYDIANTDFLTLDGVTYKVRKIENIADVWSTDQTVNYILSPPQIVTINYYYQNGDPVTDPDILKLFNDDPYDVTDYGFLSDVDVVISKVNNAMEDVIACMASDINLALITNIGKEVVINGVVYEVVEVTGDALFGIADTDKVINYFLKPPQTLILNYLDEYGNPLKKSKMVGYNFGDRYVVV